MRLLVLFCVFASLALAPAIEKYSYWVEPCVDAQTRCQAGDAELAAWALEAWQNASGGALEFARVQSREHARIRVLWASPDGGLYGETHAVQVDGQRGAEVYVLPAPFPLGGDKLMRDAIVYLTCLHESGHALGLPHTAAFEDIMYSFQYGGDISEYFGRYRRKLNSREDIQKNSGLSGADRTHLMQAAIRR
ncbi:MAG TPA: matrixin family metalloprotease [Bryobacteraceae bacterium]|nr:matrixin family metalloprotease [Bryobacteraceae bacterium]